MKAGVIRVIEEGGDQTHCRTHEPYSCADDGGLKEDGMCFSGLKDTGGQPEGAGASHYDFQKISENEFHDYNTPDGHKVPSHINASLGIDCGKDTG